MDAQTFRQIAGCFATGVAIATTRAKDGTPHGLTVNSFTSLSLDPLLVLVNIDKQAGVYDAFMQSDTYAINILQQGQKALSRQFATSGIDRFAGVNYRSGQLGAPILDGCLAFFDCKIVNRLDGGDHTIFIGEVLDGAAADDGLPLLYYRGQYRQLAP